MNAVAQQEEKCASTQPVEEERQFVLPRVNIVESKDAYVLEAEMPGVAKEGLEISLNGNELTITGRRQPGPGAGLLYRESQSADYRRAFELDPSIEAGKISARMEQGVLTLTLPKAEEVKPRRIPVA